MTDELEAEFRSVFGTDTNWSGNSGYNDPTPTDIGIDAEAENGIDPEYEDAKQRFNELVKQRRDSVEEQLDEEIAEQQRQYEINSRAATNNIWSMNDLRGRLRLIEEVQQSRINSLNGEFDALLRHNKVDAVGIRDQELLIKTVELDIGNPHSGYRVPLGAFEITIPLDARRYEYFTITNRTGARVPNDSDETFHHPHIVGSNVCLGAIEEQVITALSQGEINGGFELLLEYLQTYNPDDPYGDNIRYWNEE